MPNTQGINISQLVAPEVLTEFIVNTPLVAYAGNIGKSTWDQKVYSIDRSIDIPYPNIFLAQQGLTASDSTLIEQFINVPIQEPINVMFPYNAYDEIFTYGGPNNKPKIAQGFNERIAMPMSLAIKAKLEQFIMEDCNRSFYMTVGTAGTALSSFASISPVNALWTRMELPTANKMIIMSPENYSSLGAGMTTLFNPGFTSPILKELNIQQTAGWGLMASEFVTEHVYGTAVTDSCTVNTTMVEGSNTLLMTIGAGHTVLAGDLFSIANVNGVSPRAKINQGLMGFVASVDANVSGTVATITLSVNIYSEGPLQNVDRLPTAGDVVTWKAALVNGRRVCTKNYAIIPDSLTVISIKMPDINGANNSEATDPSTQMRMHVAMQGVIDTYVNRIRTDLAAVWKAFPPYGIVILS